MAVGTAGFTAMLAVMALEDHGVKPGQGPVPVTGRPGAAEYLASLGATQIVACADLAETVKRPLEGGV